MKEINVYIKFVKTILSTASLFLHCPKNNLNLRIKKFACSIWCKCLVFVP